MDLSLNISIYITRRKCKRKIITPSNLTYNREGREKTFLLFILISNLPSCSLNFFKRIQNLIKQYSELVSLSFYQLVTMKIPKTSIFF